VEVALHFDRRDFEALVLKELGERAGENPFAEARHDGADDDDVLVVSLAVTRGHGSVELGLVARLADFGQKFFVAHLIPFYTVSRTPHTAAACRCRAWLARPSIHKSTGRAPGHVIARAFLFFPALRPANSESRAGNSS